MSFQPIHTQSVRAVNIFGRSGLIVLLILCLLGISACGKKPSKVDAPLSAKNMVYPRTYPDPDGDPEP